MSIDPVSFQNRFGERFESWTTSLGFRQTWSFFRCKAGGSFALKLVLARENRHRTESQPERVCWYCQVSLELSLMSHPECELYKNAPILILELVDTYMSQNSIKDLLLNDLMQKLTSSLVKYFVAQLTTVLDVSFGSKWSLSLDGMDYTWLWEIFPEIQASWIVRWCHSSFASYSYHCLWM